MQIANSHDMSFDEICPICNKPSDQHNPEERSRCNIELVKNGLMRYCGLCGLTKPAKGLIDRCGKCGEKYSFSNS
ncbi:hypothetical protein NSED_05790 [Candidatus Nitrosopumilus sediminis]|uniref:Uncharacterized protein n=2 Tax=Candidatus Nitrosopumilus sediminis TaxID=1229909 RepID=K0BD63_9ARCH|nr:hypothetical protein NSED_05790 [Candidatus Nitrosopumilus sediminis]